MADKDVDAVFAEIISHWDDSAPPHAPVGAEDRAVGEVTSGESGVAEASTERDGQPAPTDALPVTRGPAHPVDDVAAEAPWPVWRGTLGPSEPAEELAEADEDAHFEPGPLAPLPPTEDLHFWGIVVGLVVGPLLLLWLVIFRPDVPSWWAVVAVALTVGGFTLLVLRQPVSRDEDDPDNGARL